MTGAFGEAVTAYLTQTAFLDTWTPTAAACAAGETKIGAGSRQKVYMGRGGRRWRRLLLLRDT